MPIWRFKNELNYYTDKLENDVSSTMSPDVAALHRAAS